MVWEISMDMFQFNSYCAMAHDQVPNYPPTYGIPPRSPRWATLCLKARVFVSRVYTKCMKTTEFHVVT